jgi:hypothetical protein
MEKRPTIAESKSRHRVRRWAREIVLAAVLTAVAVAFIANALLRGDGSAQEPSAFETARKPAGK